MNKRYLNFELLRIIAMLFIVIWHFIVKGTIHYGGGEEITYIQGAPIYNVILYSIMTIVSSCGVDLFVLLSGYFLSSSFILKLDRIFHIWMITFFYLFLIGCVAYFLFPKALSLIEIAKTLRPISGGNYWFIKCYMGMVLLAPFIANVVGNLNKRTFLVLILIMFLLAFHYTGLYFDSNNRLRLFILLFLISAYIRKFDLPSFINKNAWYILLGIWCFQMILTVFEVQYEQSVTGFKGWATDNDSLTIITSTLFFIGFKNLQLSKCKSSLEYISKYTFAVYLIHDNQFIAHFLWNKWLHISLFSPLYALYLVIIPILIFVVCFLCDIIRSYLFKLFYIPEIENIIKKYNIVIN